MTGERAGVLIVVVVGVACAHPRPEQYPGLRYGPDCDSVRALAATDSTMKRILPELLQVFIPPLPVPATVKGTTVTVHMMVDQFGRVMPDSVVLDGITDASYRPKMMTVVRHTTFRPASANGCAVSGPYSLTVSFGRR